MEDINAFLCDPKLKKWLDSCPTAWNVQYSDDWQRCCFFVCPPDKSADKFLEEFCV